MEIEHEFVLREANIFEPNIKEGCMRKIGLPMPHALLGMATTNVNNPFSDHSEIRWAKIRLYLNPFWKYNIGVDKLIDNIVHEYLHVMVKPCCSYRGERAEHWAITRLIS